MFIAIWLDWRTAANAKSPNNGVGMYLEVYVMLGIAGLIAMIAGCWCVYIIWIASDEKI